MLVLLLVLAFSLFLLLFDRGEREGGQRGSVGEGVLRGKVGEQTGSGKRVRSRWERGWDVAVGVVGRRGASGGRIGRGGRRGRGPAEDLVDDRRQLHAATFIASVRVVQN